MVLAVTAGLVLHAVSVAGLWQSPNSKRPSFDELAAGRSLYVAKCQTCHGRDGEGGDARLERVLGARPKALRSRDTQRKRDGEIAMAVRSGVGKMKPVEGLTPAEVRQIISFVRTLGR